MTQSFLERVRGLYPRVRPPCEDPPIEAALHFLNVFAAAISAGILLVVLVGVVPAVRSLSAQAGHAFHLVFDPRVDRFNPMLVAVAAVTAIALLAVEWGDGAATALTAAGLAGSAVLGVVSGVFCMPINHTVGHWRNEAVDEAEWRRLRARWNRFHLIRTSASLVALGGYRAALLS